MSRRAKACTWLHLELPVMDYVEAWNLQKNLMAARANGKTAHDIVLSLEHPPVFTLGRRGRRENLKVSSDFLRRANVPVIEVERGGDITYHGPGQLVVYPIVNLAGANLKLDEFITCLEEVMLQTAAAWDVPAGRNSLNRGIWVGDRKLGSIGITVRRGISFHGMALNVNTSLEPFAWIDPCGLHGIEMTSMERELSHKLPMDEIRSTLMRSIEKVFEVRLVKTTLPKLQHRLESLDTSVNPITDMKRSNLPF